MNNKLKAKLTELLSKAYDMGYTLEVNETLSPKKCLILSNKKSQKVALLGTMVSSEGETTVEACMDDVNKWMWAEQEGFSRDDLTNKEVLYKNIFTRVSADNLPNLLA